MSDLVELPIGAVEEAPVAAAPAASKAPKKKLAKAPRMKKPQVKANHTSFAEMVAEAITGLKERLGSSRQAIIAYISGRYNVPKDHASLYVKTALKKGEANGVLKRARESGKGAGRYKLVVVAKKKPAAKKLAAKKPAAKVKKNAAKKPGAKASKGKKVAKKPAAKKPAAKKPAAKKSAPKKPVAKKMAAKKLTKK